MTPRRGASSGGAGTARALSRAPTITPPRSTARGARRSSAGASGRARARASCRSARWRPSAASAPTGSTRAASRRAARGRTRTRGARGAAPTRARRARRTDRHGRWRRTDAALREPIGPPSCCWARSAGRSPAGLTAARWRPACRSRKARCRIRAPEPAPHTLLHAHAGGCMRMHVAADGARARPCTGSPRGGGHATCACRRRAHGTCA